MAKIPEWAIVVGLIGGGIVVTAAGFISGIMEGKKKQDDMKNVPVPSTSAGGARHTRRKHHARRNGTRRA